MSKNHDSNYLSGGRGERRLKEKANIMRISIPMIAIAIFPLIVSYGEAEGVAGVGWSIGDMKIGGTVESEAVRDFLSAYTHLANMGVQEPTGENGPVSSLILLAIGEGAKVNGRVNPRFLPGASQNAQNYLENEALSGDACIIKVLETTENQKILWVIVDLDDASSEDGIKCVTMSVMISLDLDIDGMSGKTTGDLISNSLSEMFRRNLQAN